MKTAGIALAIVVAAAAAAGGYWYGARHASTQAAATASSVPADAGTQERRIKYYRNPMGLPDTSPTPKKDPMGMDYIPVYEGDDHVDAGAAGQIRISTDKVQKLGVRTEAAAMRALDRVVRAAGRVEPDERRLYAISPKFEGYVERLHVNVTGQPVAKGQPLFEVYSPELVSAQREYAIAAQGVESLKDADSAARRGMQELADSSLVRLRNWDISEEQIRTLSKSGEARRTLTFRSPVSGIVTEKKALQGMRFMPGEALYQIADLSAVWIVADVFEQDIGYVKSGAKATVRINAYPDKTFTGRITYVYPTLKPETRTIPVRVELANPGQLLKPAMFAEVELAAGGKGNVLTVPSSAVIDSGVRRIVLVQLDEGRFEPREVQLGARSDDYVEVLKGVKDGERVVVAANFLIDAESNLKAALGGFGMPPQQTQASSPQATSGVSHHGVGIVGSVNVKAGTVSMNHEAIASLKWPAMTMEFKAANEALLQDLKPGTRVEFEFVERKPGEWVITGIKRASAAAAHSGH
jgi:membrane fusion protein, copper/silver efflux system